MATTDTSQATQAAVMSVAEKKDVIMMENITQDDLESNPQKAPYVSHIDGFNVLGLAPEDKEFYDSVSHAERQKIKHKV